jgi:virulence-associated protein VapD
MDIKTYTTSIQSLNRYRQAAKDIQDFMDWHGFTTDKKVDQDWFVSLVAEIIRHNVDGDTNKTLVDDIRATAKASAENFKANIKKDFCGDPPYEGEGADDFAP